MTTSTKPTLRDEFNKLWQSRDKTAMFRTTQSQQRYQWSVLCGIFITLAEFMVVYLLGHVFDYAKSPQLFTVKIGVWLTIFLLIIAVLVFVRIKVNYDGAAEQENNMRLQLAYTYMANNQTARSKEATGKQADLSNTGVEKIALYRAVFLSDVTVSLVSPILIAIMLGIVFSPVLGIVLLCMIPVVPITMLVFMKTTRKASANSRKARSKLASNYLEALQNLRTLVLLNAAARKSHELAEIGENNRQELMKLLRGNQMIILVMDAVISLAIICVGVVIAFYQATQGALTISDVVSVLLLLLLFLEPINHVGAFFYVGMVGIAMQRVVGRLIGNVPVETVFQEIQSVMSDADLPGKAVQAATQSQQTHDADPNESSHDTRHNDRYDDRYDDVTPANSQLIARDLPDLPQEPFEPLGLRFNRVTFEYDTQADEAPVLVELTANFEPRTHVAIIGPSGQGKSTLLSLLSGDLEPTTGSIEWITAEGNYFLATAQSLQECTAYVGQMTWMFTGTIAYNLQIGNPTATDEDMWKALKQANLANDVADMPEQLMTYIGERGMGLSGGQAQRLAIARALLSKRPILLLDEPTSQVDVSAEAEIMDVLKHLDANLTIIMITHRMASTQAMHTVVELQHNETEAGTMQSELVETHV